MPQTNLQQFETGDASTRHDTNDDVEDDSEQNHDADRDTRVVTKHDISHTDIPRVRNRRSNAWYKYDGDALFKDEHVDEIAGRIADARDDEWERVTAASPKAAALGNTNDDEWMKRAAIRTKDVELFRSEYERTLDTVTDEIDGWVLGVPEIDLFEEGPRKTVASVTYRIGGRAGIGGKELKTQQILKYVRAYEYYLYQTRVVEPVLQKYHDRYPY